MIEKTSKGYKVVSESTGKNGKHKNLSKSNLTKEQAKQRIHEVEYFKSRGK